MNYWDMVRKLAKSNKTETERGEILIKDMLRLVTDIIDYKHTKEYYKGDGTTIQDKKNSLRKSIILVMSDLDIYTEQMGFTESVKKKSSERLSKIIEKV